jgi:hypothetical protein
MGLQIFNVVAQNSHIIEACKNSDLATIRRLFDEARASPFDRDVDGYILTDWAIYPMIERLATWATPWITELRRSFGVCRFLIDTCGLDPSQSQTHNWDGTSGKTAWTTLLMFQIRNRGHPDTLAAAPWFERILRLLICKARTNPFVQAKDSIADVLELQARHLHNSIVESSFNILAGHETWTLEWDEGVNTGVSYKTTTHENLWYADAFDFVPRRIIPSTNLASEAAAKQLRSPDEFRKSFRKWFVMLERILENAPRIRDAEILELLRTIIMASHNFAQVSAFEDMLDIFRAAMRNIFLSIAQHAQKRKIIDNLRGRELQVNGLGTWVITDTLEFEQSQPGPLGGAVLQLDLGFH